MFGGTNVAITRNSVTSNNSIANAGYASIQLGGTGTLTDTLSCLAAGKTCGTLIADYISRAIVANTTIFTSGSMTANKGGGSTMVNNLIGTM